MCHEVPRGAMGVGKIEWEVAKIFRTRPHGEVRLHQDGCGRIWRCARQQPQETQGHRRHRETGDTGDTGVSGVCLRSHPEVRPQPDRVRCGWWYLRVRPIVSSTWEDH